MQDLEDFKDDLRDSRLAEQNKTGFSFLLRPVLSVRLFREKPRGKRFMVSPEKASVSRRTRQTGYLACSSGFAMVNRIPEPG